MPILSPVNILYNKIRYFIHAKTKVWKLRLCVLAVGDFLMSLLTSWELFLGVFIFCMESRYNNY